MDGNSRKRAIRLPNFLIVGAAKCGTTSLYNYLRQHPEVYGPHNKEPYFFISPVIERLNPDDPMYRGVRKRTKFTLDHYLNLFKRGAGKKAIGEASALYLYHYDVAIPRIREYLEEVKIIIVLRNPVERAFSAYTHLVRDGIESLPFERCLEMEEKRIRENWFPLHFFKELGFYYRQVKAYLENFRDIRVYLYDDFKKHTLDTVKDVYAFLGVDPSFTPDVSIKYNPSGIPRSAIIHRFLSNYDHPLKRILRPLFVRVIGKERTGDLANYYKNKNLKAISMKPETRGYLIELYRGDVLMLQDLIKRDLSSWLK